MYVYIACLEDIFFKIRKCNMNFEHIKIRLCQVLLIFMSILKMTLYDK